MDSKGKASVGKGGGGERSPANVIQYFPKIEPSTIAVTRTVLRSHGLVNLLKKPIGPLRESVLAFTTHWYTYYSQLAHLTGHMTNEILLPKAHPGDPIYQDTNHSTSSSA